MKKGRLLYLCLGILFSLALTSCQRSKVYHYDEGRYQTWIDVWKDALEGNQGKFIGIDLRLLEPDYADGHIKGFTNFAYAKKTATDFHAWVTGLYHLDTIVFLIDADGRDVKAAMTVLKQAKYRYIYGYSGGYTSLIEKAKDQLTIVTGTDDCGC